MELSSREAKERKGHKDRQVGAQFHPCEGLFWPQLHDLLLTTAVSPSQPLHTDNLTTWEGRSALRQPLGKDTEIGNAHFLS